jgi:lipase maturation factor 1
VTSRPDSRLGSRLGSRPDSRTLRWLFAPNAEGRGHLWPRWIFLRALGLIFLSAFYSLAFQIQGLIGPTGILPANDYLTRVARAVPGLQRFWYAPTLLWLGAGHGALTALFVCGGVASLLLVFNVWPRGSILVALVAFLSFIAAAQDFASYQSDGMLLEASFISLFYAPPGFRPGLGASHPPSRASAFLLTWEWFRIYFESGVVKLASGDPSWRDMTAMDHYYENGPLPTWLGYYVQHWSHRFHAFTSLMTLVIELGVVWLIFLPRPFRLACFAVVTPLQIGIIATANYAFLNYLVLSLGILLVDDEWIATCVRVVTRREPAATAIGAPTLKEPETWKLAAVALPLTWVFYATCADFLFRGAPPSFAWLSWPAHALDPFRFANSYGLFATMTPERYEIEFQGTRDNVTWTAYPFRYKPQALDAAPGIYAPYQPRFEWNLWFASLRSCRENPWVMKTEARLLENDPSVLALFASNPFGETPPVAVRTIAWQYWFTDLEEKRATGHWWRRDEIGAYCGALTRATDGRIRTR